MNMENVKTKPKHSVFLYFYLPLSSAGVSDEDGVIVLVADAFGKYELGMKWNWNDRF